MDRQRNDAAQESKTMSGRTKQSYCQSAIYFCRWARRKKRILTDPLGGFARPKVRSKDYKRRAITTEEWRYLRSYLATDEMIRVGLDPEERRLLYELALVTALRAKEIASLKRSSFDFDRNVVRCTDTKNHRTADQSLTASLATSLKRHLAHKMPGAKAFGITCLSALADTIRRDFAAARLVWIAESKTPEEIAKREGSDFLALKNGVGEILDFHSLRHTCGSWLAAQGIHPKVIQRVMRHSTITLTMDTYGHLFPEQESAAIAALQKATS